MLFGGNLVAEFYLDIYKYISSKNLVKILQEQTVSKKGQAAEMIENAGRPR